ncbi:hypothetical protein B0H19DRAFT_1071663 [Mycena capillaripes]|nr:hypothetical protein B0H19DRAFT_1071663 [Mycena capillaripes]
MKNEEATERTEAECTGRAHSISGGTWPTEISICSARMSALGVCMWINNNAPSSRQRRRLVRKRVAHEGFAAVGIAGGRRRTTSSQRFLQFKLDQPEAADTPPHAHHRVPVLLQPRVVAIHENHCRPLPGARTAALVRLCLRHLAAPVLNADETHHAPDLFIAIAPMELAQCVEFFGWRTQRGCIEQRDGREDGSRMFGTAVFAIASNLLQYLECAAALGMPWKAMPALPRLLSRHWKSTALEGYLRFSDISPKSVASLRAVRPQPPLPHNFFFTQDSSALMLAYVFDMTYRKVNAILWGHHTLTSHSWAAASVAAWAGPWTYHDYRRRVVELGIRRSRGDLHNIWHEREAALEGAQIHDKRRGKHQHMWGTLKVHLEQHNAC